MRCTCRATQVSDGDILKQCTKQGDEWDSWNWHRNFKNEHWHFTLRFYITSKVINFVKIRFEIVENWTSLHFKIEDYQIDVKEMGSNIRKYIFQWKSFYFRTKFQFERQLKKIGFIQWKMPTLIFQLGKRSFWLKHVKIVEWNAVSSSDFIVQNIRTLSYG